MALWPASVQLLGTQPAGSTLFVVLAIVVSLIVLAKSGSMFTDGALALAHHLRIPPILVGATLVSVATTVPELTVSWMATAAGSPDVALGNLLGSCSCNLGLVVGASALLYAWLRRRRTIGPQVVISFRSVKAPWLLTLVAIGLLWASGLWSGMQPGSPAITPWESAALLCVAPLYFAFCVWTRARHPVGSATAAPEPAWGLGRSVAAFLAAAAVVLLCSRILFVNSAQLARELGVSEMVIGFTVVAVGTSLPELVCSVCAVMKGRADLGVGNILGANILNLSAGIGLAAVIGPVSIHQRAMALYVPGVLLLTLLFGLRVRREGRLSGRTGVILLGAYASYLVLALRLDGS